MGTKYADCVYEDVRQNLGYDENDSSVDVQIDAMSRSEVFERVLEWNNIVRYGYTMRCWVKDIFGIDLDENTGEDSNSVHDLATVPGDKYSNEVMGYVRQRMGLEEDDKSRDAEIEAMNPFEVFSETLEWNGLLGDAETVAGFVEDVYEVDLWEIVDYERW